MEQFPYEYPERVPEIHLRDYIQVIFRRRWIIFTFFIVVVTTVLISTFKQIPIYQATTTIRIEHSSPQVVSVQEVTPMGASGYAYRDYYETQYKLIKSYTVLKRVVDALGMSSAHNEKDREGDPAKKLAGAVRVNVVRNSQLVEISAEDPVPEMAAKIADTVAEEFIRQNLERNINAANDAARWLSHKIEEQRQKLKDAEIALQEYREKHNLSILPHLDGDESSESIKTEYAGLQSLYANYAERYTDAHPKMVELKAQIESLKNKIQGLEDINLGDKTMEYRVLEREVQTNKRMYEILLTRLKEIDLSSTLNVNNVSIIDRAQVPVKPVKPKVKLNLLLAVIVGAMGGIGLGFFVEYLDTTIKSPEDLQEATGFRFLGAIPAIEEERDEIRRDKMVYYKPHSVVAELYRSIRTEITQLISLNQGPKAILFASAEPQAGKTITSSNLALAFAQGDKRVVFVDCDLRKPQLDKVFGVERNPGVAEYLLENTSLDAIIKDTEEEGLKIITSGRIPPNPAEVIDSERMKQFISQLKERFDVILFDSPPVISVTDAAILAEMLDYMIWVVRSGKTFVPLMRRVKDKFSRVNEKILGSVLNDVKAHHSSYYYDYYRYYDYYGGEGAQSRRKKLSSVSKSNGRVIAGLANTVREKVKADS